MLENKVIVLNADYSFMNIVTPQKAFSYISRDKVVIEKYGTKTLTSGEKSFIIPLVVRFTYLVRQIFGRRVPWSKKNVLIRDDYVCGYCGIRDKNHMTVDHVIPKADGGKNTFENCSSACKPCNNRKGDRSCRQMGMYPKHRLTQPTISEFMKLWYKQFNVEDIIKTLWD